ncbi:unnamed protein product [Ectocarpus sp. 12 AP-2014]
MDLFFAHKQRQRDRSTWRVCTDKTESKPCCYQKVAECSLANIDVLKGKLERSNARIEEELERRLVRQQQRHL